MPSRAAIWPFRKTTAARRNDVLKCDSATRKLPAASNEGAGTLPLPRARCLTKEQAADYLGIGVTLFEQQHIPAVRFGRRVVYDRLDLDAWLNEYKHRGRAGKEGIQKWPVKPESTGGKIRASGGSMLSYRTAGEYAKVLGLKTETKQKPSLQD